LVNLSKGQSSYDYLTTFNSWLNSSIEVYSGYYKIFYPLFFLGMATQGIVSNLGVKLIAKLAEMLPTDIIILGQPYYLILAITIVTLFFCALRRGDLPLGFEYCLWSSV